MKTEWDYTHLYPSDKEWEEDKSLIEKELKNLEESIGKCFSDKALFLQVIKQKFHVQEKIERLYCYGKRHLDQDSTDSDMQVRVHVAWDLYTKFLKLDSVLEKEITEHEDLLLKWMKDPMIGHYQVYFGNILRHKKHLVSSCDHPLFSHVTKEQLLITNMYRSLVEQDMKFPTFQDHRGKEVVANGKNVNRYAKSEYRTERKDAYLAHMEGYKNISHAMASLLNMKLSCETVKSQLRGYENVLAMKLSEEDLPKDTVSKLITSVHHHLDVPNRYHKLRQDILQLEEYHTYDKMFPLSTLKTKHYDLEEALHVIKDALYILGDEAIAYIDRALEEGWIDFYEKDHKRTDSFTCISYTGVPYVSINFKDNLTSLRTLGHELGHMIHTAYAKDHQPFEFFEYSLFLAEIASKVNEILVDQYLISHTSDREEKIFLLENSIQSTMHSFYQQILLTEFELTLYQKHQENGSVSYDDVLKTYTDINKEYYEKSMVYDDDSSYAWASIPHFYLYDSFYLWQYATGICIARDIVHKLKTEKNFKEKYIQFLSAGGSVSIKDALKLIDIDLEKESYVDHMILELQEELDTLEKVLKK